MRLSRCHRKPALPRVLAAAAALLALAGFVPGTLGATAAYARPAAVPVRLAVPVLPPAAVPATIPPRLYTVRAGDTLSAIASRLCGHAASWRGIYAASRHVVGPDPDLILPGQRLTVACTAPPVLLAASLRHVAVRRAASAARHGGNYGHPYFCGDGDGDGWDLPCPASRHATAPARASYVLAHTAAAAIGGYSGGTPGGAFGRCVVARESGGNAQVMNASGHYGLYQFSASTWAAYGGSPATFGHASVAEQERVFAAALARGGQSNWSPYDGC